MRTCPFCKGPMTFFDESDVGLGIYWECEDDECQQMQDWIEENYEEVVAA